MHSAAPHAGPQAPTRKTRAADVALLVASVAVLLGLAEAALRVGYGIRHRLAEPKRPDMRGSAEAYDDPADYYGRYDTNPVMDYSTYLGYVSRAGMRGNGYRTNRHHARYDEDFPAAKPAGELRVFVTGGSTAWGQGVSQAQVLTAVAERELGRAFPQRRVRVVSMGVTGYGSVQERIMVENLILDLEPDCVVMFSGWNDSYLGYAGKDVLVEHDFLKFRDVLARRRPGVAPPPGKPEVYPPEYDDYSSKLAYFVDVRLHALRHRALEPVEQALRRQALPPGRVVAAFERNLEILADLSRRRGFRLVLALQPSIYTTGRALSPGEREMVTAAKTLYAGFGEYNRAVYEALRRELPEHARRLGYRFADLDAAILGEPHSVFVDHVHFGSRGNRLLGVELASLLARELGAGP